MKTVTKLIIIGLIIIINPKLTITQNYFSKVYFNPNESILSSSIVSTFNDSYIICGQRNENNFLVKVDSEGNSNWNKSFDNKQSLISSDIIKLKDSSFLFVSDNYLSGTQNNPLLCININIDGDTLWTNKINLGNWTKVHSAQQTSDDGFIITTNVAHNDDPYNKIVIIKLDPLGNLQWSKSYIGGNTYNNAFSIKQTTDTGFIVTGSVYNRDPWYTQAFLMKLNHTGEVIWSYTYKSISSNYSYAYYVLEDDDGFLISMEVAGKFNLLKTDLSGNIIWARSYNTWFDGTFFEEHYRRIIKTNDSTYTVLAPDMLIQIDDIGNILWTTFFHMYVTDFAKSDDKGFLVIGNGPIIGVKSRITNDPQIGLIKVDSLGQSNMLCSDLVSISHDSSDIVRDSIVFLTESLGNVAFSNIEITSEPFETEDACVAFIGSTPENSIRNIFKVFPNPSSGLFYIKSHISCNAGSILVTDVTGNTIIKFDMNGSSWKINLDGIPSGLYYLQIITNTSTETHKVIVL